MIIFYSFQVFLPIPSAFEVSKVNLHISMYDVRCTMYDLGSVCGRRLVSVKIDGEAFDPDRQDT